MSVEEIEISMACSAPAPATRYPEWFQKFLVEAAGNPSVLDAGELSQRREAVRQIDELRAGMSRKYGVQPDSTPMIRAMSDHE